MHSKKSATFALAVTFAFLIALAFSAKPAYAQAFTLQNQPLTFGVKPACNGDAVTGSGKFNLTMNFVTNPDGTVHAESDMSGNGTGTGSPSGTSYVFNFDERNSGTVTVSGTGEMTGTLPISFELIAQGAGENLYLTLLGHFTVTPAGVVSVYFTDFDITCHG